MASSSSSSSQAAAALVANRAAEEEKEKPRLTDREKKANHIASGKCWQSVWVDPARITVADWGGQNKSGARPSARASTGSASSCPV
jgi:hypothetical protein